jgi:hypothetical protein
MLWVFDWFITLIIFKFKDKLQNEVYVVHFLQAFVYELQYINTKIKQIQLFVIEVHGGV